MTELDLKNYPKEKIAMSFVKANILGIIVAIPIAVLLAAFYFWIWKNSPTDNIIDSFFFSNFVLYAIVSFTLGTALHELIHGLLFAKYAKNGFKSVKFGVNWKTLTPYCHCSEPLQVKHYILVSIMPAIILGFIPYIIGIVIGSEALFLFGTLFTVVAVGDFIMVFLLLRENKNAWVQDLPDEVGCIIYRAK